jgi:hypothetical protein
MATLNFTIDEAMNILAANTMLPGSIKDVRAEQDGLLVTVSGNIAIQVRPESFANGILKITFASDSWAFKLAASLGKIDPAIDDAIRPYPFIRREGKVFMIDLDRALQTRIKGIRVKNFELRDGAVRIEI